MKRPAFRVWINDETQSQIRSTPRQTTCYLKCEETFVRPSTFVIVFR